MVEILFKKKGTRLRVKNVDLPQSNSPVLGTGIDVMTLPEGHLSCPKCKNSRFECWVYLDKHRIEMGCVECNWSTRLLFPLDVVIPGGSGRFTCARHPRRAMVLIHNIDVISIGCEMCVTELNIQLKKKGGLILAEDMN